MLLEEADFFVDVVAFGAGGRADDDEGGGGVQCGERLAGKGVARRKVVAIAEDRAERLGDGSAWRWAADQIAVDLERFELLVQPAGFARVGVRVRNEGAVFDRERSGLENGWGGHGTIPR